MRANDLPLVSLDANNYSGSKTSNTFGAAVTGGLVKARIKSVIEGATASLRTHDPNVEFYFIFEAVQASLGSSSQPWGAGQAQTSPNQFALLKLDERDSRREVSTASIGAFGAEEGTDSKNAVGFKYEKLKKGVYRVIPNVPLAPGEYGFFPKTSGGMGTAGSTRLYDFGVAPP